ncbi:MAG: amino acid ABC transporter permease [Kaiparowitsia implicata GSE-PSE-MK54-09C]|jgi:general L-amino acid transport system permease protein|nr:amino acid ABC transporter permease [Kaiparowitsia implicata GSE-PSE-MK54-09C]
MSTTFPTSAPPAIAATGPVAWLRKNLFNTWLNSLLTLIIGALLVMATVRFGNWAVNTAQWAVIPANFQLYFVGRYPTAQYWRLWTTLGIIVGLSGLTWGYLLRHVRSLFSRNVLIWLGIAALVAFITPTPVVPFRLMLVGMLVILVATAWLGWTLGSSLKGMGRWLSLGWAIAFLVGFWLVGGGYGLRPVATSNWGGLMLTLMVAIASILLCFPLGVLLALGRQSPLPVLRWLSIIYIEVIRGIPLLAILFIGQSMIPLFLPQGVRPDNVIRAIIGLTMFSAAYLAENVRGGLQAIPRGQSEASNALGLNPVLTTGLIVLPQALKISIPAIVGQFISLFQDTTLLSIVGIVELLGISRSILANPAFIGRYWEVYIFIGAIYWVFCYAMSLASRRLERQLKTDN